ncbi:MAG: hypothetical protein ACTS27_06245 [Phycisphaerales bacterium]
MLWALALVGAVAAAYAYATRTSVAQVRAEAERAQAYYAARGACIQSVKDLSTGVRRAELTRGAQRTAEQEGFAIDQETGGVQIGDLPTFPAEMAAAGGLLGAIAERMNQLQGEPRTGNRTAEPDGAGGNGRTGARGRRGGGRAVEVDAEEAPLIVLGQGTMNFGGARVEVWLEAESGKLNINYTPRRVLERLLVEMGEPPLSARALVDDIEMHRIEQRDGPGAERPAVNIDAPIEGRDFRSIEELGNVPTIDPALLERLMGVLTVYGSGTVDPNYAGLEVLRAIGVVDRRPLEFALVMQEERERITREAFRQAMGPGAYERVEQWLTFSAPSVFTARTRATVGESSARYLIRVAPGYSADTGANVTRLLESREDWL